ncbi:MAG: imelysin family protein [Azoarcus sp.]|nr:imelysin family protein [Azoarcus sp.]
MLKTLIASARIATIACTALLVTPTQAAAPTSRAVLENYAVLVEAGYADSVSSARNLEKAVQSFIANPSETGLSQARKVWLDARNWYGQTEAFRFYGGPIDGEDGPEGLINAWPLDEAYIDYVEGNPGAGIVNDSKEEITAERLAQLNERGGEENVATGWHAIEFLLWGQDRSETGPGDRKYTDFVDGQAPNADRRRLYLATITRMLVKELEGVADAWAPGKKNYRAAFVASDQQGIQRMLTGLGTLSRGELAGERMEVAMDTQDQEDEHSCFSDNTHMDIVANARGILNVWEGRYLTRDGRTLAGASLKALVAAKNADVGAAVSSNIATSLRLAEAIQAPFDREIIGNDDSPGRKRVQAVIDSLKKQADGLVEAARVLGITRLNTSV